MPSACKLRSSCTFAAPSPSSLPPLPPSSLPPSQSHNVTPPSLIYTRSDATFEGQQSFSHSFLPPNVAPMDSINRSYRRQLRGTRSLPSSIVGVPRSPSSTRPLSTTVDSRVSHKELAFELDGEDVLTVGVAHVCCCEFAWGAHALNRLLDARPARKLLPEIGISLTVGLKQTHPSNLLTCAGCACQWIEVSLRLRTNGA